MSKVKTNFGAINGRRVLSFKVTDDGLVAPAKYRDLDNSRDRYMLFEDGLMIPAREAFRRWKIARKGWQTRKWGKQLPLNLETR